MKIIQDSSDKIVLGDSGLSSFIGGFILLVVGIATAGIALYSYLQGGASSKSSLFAWLIPGIFFIIGLLILFTARSKETVLDKEQGQGSITSAGILGKKTDTFNLGDIVRVEMRENYSYSTTTGPTINAQAGMAVRTTAPQRQFRLVLVMQNGTEIFIDNAHTENLSASQLMADAVQMSGSGREANIGQKIAAFAGVPFQTPGIPSINVGPLTMN
ncbi:MAG: hypothetical protein WAN50_04410 [Minisyncoccia bacterium]